MMILVVKFLNVKQNGCWDLYFGRFFQSIKSEETHEVRFHEIRSISIYSIQKSLFLNDKRVQTYHNIDGAK